MEAQAIDTTAIEAAAQVAEAPPSEPVTEVKLRPVVAQAPQAAAVHAGELEWFWCWGQSVFERSTFGALLERQALFGQEAQVCDRCSGHGFDGEDGSCPDCRGCGISKPKRLGASGKGVLLSTERCGPCHGRSGRAECQLCRGRGYIERHHAHVASQSREAAHYVPDDAALTRYAVVSRWLLALDARSPMAVDVLETYYGLEGLRWGRAEGYERVLSVGPLTPSGKRLMRAHENRLELAVPRHFENVVLSAKTKTEKVSRDLLRACQREATALHDAACQLWAQAVASCQQRKRAV